MTQPSTAGHRRAAVTLVEVLAVCVIIGILASLAMPALARAIARSRLTQCTNNQYQVAFALLRYDEQSGSVPGWIDQTPAGINVPWTVALLPFLGRNDIYDMWPTLPNNPTIDTFICPANRPNKSITYPVVHYAGNVGASGTNVNDGIFLNLMTGNSTISLNVVAEADGTSTTLAFAEKAASDFQPHAWNFAQSVVPPPFGSGTTAPPVFGAATPPGPVTPVINNSAIRSFAPSSTHSGGVVVAFCDGHTAFLSDKLQPYEYGQLLTPRSRWRPVVSGTTNSAAMQPWLRTNGLPDGTPYLLDEKALRP